MGTQTPPRLVQNRKRTRQVLLVQSTRNDAPEIGRFSGVAFGNGFSMFSWKTALNFRSLLPGEKIRCADLVCIRKVGLTYFSSE